MNVMILRVEDALGMVLKCLIVTKWVRYLLSESASLRGMDSDVAMVFVSSLWARCSEGCWAGTAAHNHLEKLNEFWKKHSVFLMRYLLPFCGEIETSPNVVCAAHSKIVRSQG